MKHQKSRVTALILLVLLTGACIFTYRIWFGRYKPAPECAGIWNTIQNMPYAHVYQTEIDRDAGTMLMIATVESDSHFIEESGSVIRNVNAYLSANPNAPEHQYRITIRVTLENDSEPLCVQYFNYDTAAGGDATDCKPLMYKCLYDAVGHVPRQCDAEQLGRLVFLQSLELQNSIEPEHLPLLDALSDLRVLRITGDSNVSPDICTHLKETHPDCRIVINNTVIQDGEKS